jgi:CRP-like cAMP-binding protein
MLPEDAAKLLPLFMPLDLPTGAVLSSPDEALEYACFVDVGVISAVARFHDGKRAEVATVGREGFVGLENLLGHNRSAFDIMVQVPGRGRRIKLDNLSTAMAESSTLRRLMLNYAQAQMIGISQTVACNAVHPVEQRAARWLMMTHDRMGPGFELTQEYLAIMLGVRRPTVNGIAQALQERGAIRYTRGVVIVTDPGLLESFACPCYRAVRNAYERAIPGCYH